MADMSADIGGDGCERQVEKVTAIAARLGVHGDFIRVPQLAKALGISSTSIHAQIRRGSFPIQHRRVGNVIVVKLDDYVRWFETGASIAAKATEPQQVPQRAREESEVMEVMPAKPHLARRETSKEFKARIHREVIADMRRKGFDVE
ncbi:hypothetical protein DBR47_12335 [Paucibacter sp. KBW04]|uniref:helix-turn-helix transcriptional regulator n=1 Tax=Paucibacter sp. KBW04 TaxID=2153361 RepID=UPI000F5738FF|nr:helix-turn-helix domain-containing protein [Paucibacter sp. KBW04]RQO58494.1 hypothetical protein DBR47_12335 [Paucibacter sp. KBW04]